MRKLTFGGATQLVDTRTATQRKLPFLGAFGVLRLELVGDAVGDFDEAALGPSLATEATVACIALVGQCFCGRAVVSP